MDLEFIENLKSVHIAAWNEKDRQKRDALLVKIYHDNIRMYDPNTIFYGLSSISDFIGKLHSDDKDFLFSEANPIEFSQNGARLFGHIGNIRQPAIFNSMDFFIVESGKVSHLYVFMSPVGNKQ